MRSPYIMPAPYTISRIPYTLYLIPYTLYLLFLCLLWPSGLKIRVHQCSAAAEVDRLFDLDWWSVFRAPCSVFRICALLFF